MPTDLAIRLRNVSKTYRLYKKNSHQVLDALGLARLIPEGSKPRELHALKALSLEVPRGARLGVIGRNGAGKTTLLKLLTGNFLATTGEVHTSGKLIALVEIGKGFHPEFTGYENIRASVTYNGLSMSEIGEAVEDIIEFCELGPFLHQPLKTYSLGMKSRLFFACATAVKPDVLIIDEVLGAGDGYFTVRSAERMKQLTENGCTLVLVSHAIPQILKFCDEAIWLEAGTVVKQGPALEVVKAYDEFIKAMEAERGRAVPGGVAALQNQWLRDHLLERILSASERNKAEEEVDSSSGVIADGGISRWTSAEGPKISNVEVWDEDGPVSQVITGCTMEIRLTVNQQLNRRFKCRYSVVIFTNDARWVCRFHSPVHEFDGREGSTHSVTLRLSPLLLSNGEYIVSLGIYDDTPLDQVTDAVRYDVLSLSYQFRVIDQIKTERAIFHHPCEWSVDDAALAAAVVKAPGLTRRA